MGLTELPTQDKNTHPRNRRSAPAGVPIRVRGKTGLSTRPKSERTRERLCQATAKLLDSTPLRDLRAGDIAAMAEVAPATFYLYFADVNEAVLAVLDDLLKQVPDLPVIIQGMEAANLPSQVRLLVKTYMGFWRRNYAVLRTRNLRADEADVRFRDARAAMLQPTVFALASKIEELRGEELRRYGVRPLAMSTVVLATLERLAGVVHLGPPHRDLAQTHLINAAVLNIVDQLTPRELPVIPSGRAEPKRVAATRGAPPARR